MNNIPKGADYCYVQVLETGEHLHIYHWNDFSPNQPSIQVDGSTYAYYDHVKYLAVNYSYNKDFYGIISIYDLRIHE